MSTRGHEATSRNSNRGNRELKQRRFWATHVNRKWGLLICLDSNKFVLLSFFSLIKTIYLRVSTKLNCLMMQKSTSSWRPSLKNAVTSSLMFSGWQAATRFQALVRSCQPPPPSGSCLTANLLLFPTHRKGNTVKCRGYYTVRNVMSCLSAIWLTHVDRATDPISVAFFNHVTFFSDINHLFQLLGSGFAPYSTNAFYILE